jgi:hypothetical protein
VSWVQAPFLDVVEHWPDGHAGLIDPDHHIGARLPADVMRQLAGRVLDMLWDAEQVIRQMVGDDGVVDEEQARLAVAQACRTLVDRYVDGDHSKADKRANPAGGWVSSPAQTGGH